MGFPPSFYDYSQPTSSTTSTPTSASTATTTSSFITIESIDVSGRAIIKIHSRILKKEVLNDIQLDLDNLDHLNDKIKVAATRAMEKKGRKGCSVDEVYGIIQSHFHELIRRSLKYTVADLAFTALNNNSGRRINDFESSSMKSLKEMRKVVSGTKDVFINYAKDVGVKTTEDIIEQNLAGIGFSEAQVHQSMSSIHNAINERFFDRNSSSSSSSSDSTATTSESSE